VGGKRAESSSLRFEESYEQGQLLLLEACVSGIHHEALPSTLPNNSKEYAFLSEISLTWLGSDWRIHCVTVFKQPGIYT
jgi:hypothetical protein